MQNNKYNNLNNKYKNNNKINKNSTIKIINKKNRNMKK